MARFARLVLRGPMRWDDSPYPETRCIDPVRSEATEEAGSAMCGNQPQVIEERMVAQVTSASYFGKRTSKSGKLTVLPMRLHQQYDCHYASDAGSRPWNSTRRALKTDTIAIERFHGIIRR